ncbi:AraC family transcriptional regulator [Halalkalibacter hemicellulosilyticus]|uniref:MSM (Multiple sugar metabolism) operon regulatory protein n=1 Tax=Halalkalibacter hemicellulosilyticusJCM 9152 TaxID=1236971 RepID=W4QBK4_9BACI|nr:AraC family transcriptional regulator [Halalkalibacter hemicellulosilyticus]GAE29400.1 MSM (multiple sugar metabolism) operon regulatory protein [Halalkalibacter hemicellulosilyticusJCM 9152]
MQTKFTNSARYKCLEHLKKNSYDLYLCYCGKEECDPNHSYGPVSRTEYLLHYIIKGKGILKVGSKTYHISKNEAFLIYPSEVTYYEADKNDPWTYIWIGFDGLKAETCLINASFSKEKRVQTFKCEEDLTNYVNNMLDASKLTYANELKREGYLYMFLSSLIQEKDHMATKESKSYDYPFHIYVEHALEFISHNYEKNIKIHDIANYIGINRSYLTTIFKKILKVSPQEYLVKYRLEKACTLLKTTDLLVNEIAAEVGYTNPLTFSKVFKNYYRISPKRYRAQKQDPLFSDKK